MELMQLFPSRTVLRYERSIRRQLHRII